MKKPIKKPLKKDIPYALVNNAYASLILPRLKRLKYDHDKIIKPKPDVYINIKSDEIDDYYNLPNKIDLNGPYQAALYKIDIEKTIDFDKYKGEITIVNLDNDIKNFNFIKAEIEEVSKHPSNYTIKPKELANNVKIITGRKTDKQKKINELFNKLESLYYKNKTKTEYQKISTLITINFPENDLQLVKNPEKIQVKFNEFETLDILKAKFNYTLDNKTLTFSSKSNYLINYEENFKIPNMEINFIQGTDIIDNKLEIKYTNLPKINLMQPIYCDIIHNNVSNNNVLTYVNIKNNNLSEPLDAIENITYFKVTQSNINRIKIYFTDELNNLLKLLKYKYFFTIHLKPL